MSTPKAGHHFFVGFEGIGIGIRLQCASLSCFAFRSAGGSARKLFLVCFVLAFLGTFGSLLLSGRLKEFSQAAFSCEKSAAAAVGAGAAAVVAAAPSDANAPNAAIALQSETDSSLLTLKAHIQSVNQPSSPPAAGSDAAPVGGGAAAAAGVAASAENATTAQPTSTTSTTTTSTTSTILYSLSFCRSLNTAESFSRVKSLLRLPAALPNDAPIFRLKFVHIPKNAGTTIENVGADFGLLWGKHDADCLNQFQCTLPVSSWHCPLQRFAAGNPFANAAAAENVTVFAVVRHPYERMRSNFGCPHVRGMSKRGGLPLHDLNLWVPAVARQIAKNPAVYDGHFLPQTDYVFDGNKTIVSRVLRFENLASEFFALARDFGAPALTIDRQENPTIFKGRYRRQTLNQESRRIIYNLYKQDFERFYPNEMPPI